MASVSAFFSAFFSPPPPSVVAIFPQGIENIYIYYYFEIMNVTDQLHYVISQIKKIRAQKGYSQMTLSLQSNLSQSFLASIETGKKMPSLLTIIKIANALNISPKDLF